MSTKRLESRPNKADPTSQQSQFPPKNTLNPRLGGRGAGPRPLATRLFVCTTEYRKA